MIPEPEPYQGSSEFPFIGISVIILALHALLLVIAPPTLYRSVVATTASFALGYCVLALIAGRHVRLTAAEILAFSVGLAILMTALSALAISLVRIPITEFAVVTVGLPIGILTWLLRRSRVRPWTAAALFGRRYFVFSDYSKGEKAIAASLLTAVIVALAVLVSLALVEYPDRPSPAIAITGPDGTPATLPTVFLIGQPQGVNVTVLGEILGSVRVRLVPANAAGNESFHSAAQGSSLQLDPFAEYRENITISAGGSWSRSFSIVILASGEFNLRFELLDSAGTEVGANRLAISVP